MSGRRLNRDHLRVCGADAALARAYLTPRGSSPRVRSRLVSAYNDHPETGIISACAEQTANPPVCAELFRDHLRVCGADIRILLFLKLELGSSPRVRSRRWCRVRGRATGGIISACAEQTHSSHEPNPRMTGSSPRVRSRPVQAGVLGKERGIISACAEQT